ncbi:MAG: hypothetical protein ABIW94_08075 [Gemmatimonadaceae bacterium]
MPVTAKLSRKFYERFGDDIAGELVDWFNAVDLTYQTQLRELNELNWERFKATLQGEIATLRGELRSEVQDLRSEMHAMRGDLRSEMHALHKDLIKWMFVFWCGNMLGLGGLIVGLLGLR